VKYTYKIRPYKTVSGTTYYGAYSSAKGLYRLAKTSISSAKATASKKVTIQWKKNAAATGYQLQYSTSSSFSSGVKTVKITSASTLKKVVSGLTKGKTYYFRVRSYKTVSGKTYYSSWSVKKSVKAK